MKDSVNSLHDYSICLDTRTIVYFREIDQEGAESFIKNLHVLDNYKDGTIHVKLSSEGGCVSSGFAMYDAIRACKNYVKVYGYSEIASMATVVLQAADSRILMPNSYLLLHEGEQTVSGHPKSNKSWLELYREFDDRCYNIYLTKINERQKQKKKKQLTLDDLKKLLEHDTILLPKKVVQLGLADEIQEGSY